jgi:hypothetical protein
MELFDKYQIKIIELQDKINVLTKKQINILQYNVKRNRKVKMCKQIGCTNEVNTKKTRCNTCLKRNTSNMLKYRQNHPLVYEKMRLYATKRYHNCKEKDILK